MDDMVGKPYMLKEINSSMIERLIYKSGPLSKPKLSELSSLSLPTVNKIVDTLERQGRIKSAGFTSNKAGRQAELYVINKDLGSIIALYYFGGEYICKIADITGTEVYKAHFKLNTGSREEAVKDTFSAIDKMIGAAPADVKAIGIGVPCAILPDGTLLGIPKIKAWEGFCLLDALKERYDAEIYLENDANLSAVGYYRKHLADELENIVYIYAGDGFGSGIIINGKLYKGSVNCSGELGFMAPLNGEAPTQNYSVRGGYLESQFKPIIYDEINAKTNSLCDGIVTVNILTSIAANYISIINPDAIVFGGEAVNAAMICKVQHLIKLYSPERNIPGIIYDGSIETGIEGLIQTCVNSISTQLQVVQSGGV